MTGFSRAELSAHLDGDLPADREAQLQQALAVDAELRRELDAMRELRDAAGDLAVHAPANDLWPGIAARIGARPPAARRRWLPLAASLLIGIGIGVMMPRAGQAAPHDASEPRFLLLLHEPAAMQQPQDPAAQAATVARYRRWAGEMARQGALVLGEKLHDGEGYLLRQDGERERPQRDGIGGLFVLRAADYAAARALARTCPHVSLGGTIELRRIDT